MDEGEVGERWWATLPWDEEVEPRARGIHVADAGAGASSSLSCASSSLTSSSLGRMEAKASGLEKEGAVSNDILLEELRPRAL